MSEAAATSTPSSSGDATGAHSSNSTENTQIAATGAEGGNLPSEQSIDADPNLTKAEKTEIKKTIKQLKIKFNGKEFNEELPFEIPDNPEAIKYMQNKLQMDKLARHKSQEAADYQKTVEQFLSDLRKNPRKVLSDPNLGVDLKKIAAEMIEEEIENSRKSPEQLEKEKYQAELKALKEEREKEKEDYNKREFERLQQQELERYDMSITKALSSSDLPKSPYVVKRMADYMLLGLQKGIDINADDVLPLVRQEMQDDLKEMFAAMPEDVVEALIGKDVITKIRKKNLQKAKAAGIQPQPSKKVADVGVTSKKEEAAKPKIKAKDFFGF